MISPPPIHSSSSFKSVSNVNSPSTAAHFLGISSPLYALHPSVDFPSNNSTHSDSFFSQEIVERIRVIKIYFKFFIIKFYMFLLFFLITLFQIKTANQNLKFGWPDDDGDLDLKHNL